MVKEVDMKVENDPNPDEESTPESRGDVLDTETTDDGGEGKKTPKGGKEKEEDKPDPDAADEGKGDAKGAKDGENEEEEEEPAKKVVSNRVPLSRLNAVISQRREAEAKVKQLSEQLDRLQGGKKGADPTEKITAELEKLYEEVEVARADGKSKEAARIQREIDTRNRELARVDASTVAVRHALQAAEGAAYDAFVEEIEVKFPELNPDREEIFDSALATEVMELRDAFIARGTAPKRALQRAMEYVFQDEYLETGTAHLYKKEASTKAPPDKKTKETSSRKIEDVKRNIDAAKKTPPNLEGAGRDGGEGKINIEHMSEEDFDKLPKSTRERLRGDFV